MNLKRHVATLLAATVFLLLSSQGNAQQLTINIRYSGENGNARKYVQEMEESGIAARIRALEGCLRYDYFFPADDPEGLLLIDEWADQEALNRYHTSPMMEEAAALREKYKLGGRQVRMFHPATPAAPAGPNRAPQAGQSRGSTSPAAPTTPNRQDQSPQPHHSN